MCSVLAPQNIGGWLEREEELTWWRNRKEQFKTFLEGASTPWGKRTFQAEIDRCESMITAVQLLIEEEAAAPAEAGVA